MVVAGALCYDYVICIPFLLMDCIIFWACALNLFSRTIYDIGLRFVMVVQTINFWIKANNHLECV